MGIPISMPGDESRSGRGGGGGGASVPGGGAGDGGGGDLKPRPATVVVVHIITSVTACSHLTAALVRLRYVIA
jgi:hypothetical protein